jgi:hypothetical protein
LRSECAQNYKEQHFLRQTEFRFAGKAPEASAVSMGLAYLGFERVSAGVASYRNSVLEADLARNIDRQLISYQALARYRGIMW